MPGIWIYSEDGNVARQLMRAGQELKQALGQPLYAITLAENEAAGLVAAGAEEVYVLTGAGDWPEHYAGEIAALLEKAAASVVLVGGTLRGKDVAAKVAAHLDAGLVTDAQTLQVSAEGLQTSRLLYGGLAVSEETTTFPALATVPPRTFAEAEADAGRQGAVHTVMVTPPAQGIMVSQVCPIDSQGVDIAAAERIVCVGRGLSKKEELTLAENLARVLRAELGCTRGIAEDYHWLPAERYIGISGQKVKPELYLALGVSGQVQHIVGVRDAKIIVAVDTNEKAPIFAAADYGIVGDLNEVAPLLTEALAKR